VLEEIFTTRNNLCKRCFVRLAITERLLLPRRTRPDYSNAAAAVRLLVLSWHAASNAVDVPYDVIPAIAVTTSQGGSLPDMPPLAGVRASSSGEMSHDTFFKMTVPDAAEKYLRLATKTKPTSEIATSLLNGGLKSTSKDFTGMVKTVLSRDARFVK
jgi:hypothetical protein